MDNHEKETALKVIDGMIAEAEREVADMQSVVQQFQMLQISLNALRHSRAAIATQDIGTPAPPMSPLPSPRVESVQIDEDAEARLTPGSVSSLIVETLKEVKRPLPLRVMLNMIRQKGKHELGYRALSSVISQCLARGLVQRVGPGLYAYTEGGKTGGPNAA